MSNNVDFDHNDKVQITFVNSKIQISDSKQHDNSIASGNKIWQAFRS